MRVRYRCSFNHHPERKIGTEEMRLDQRKSGKPELLHSCDHDRPFPGYAKTKKNCPLVSFTEKKITSKM